MKEQKGVTIVTLIITIIVMIILAGVTIATALLDRGVIQQSRNARNEHREGEELEKIKLVASEACLEGLGTITEENLIKALDTNIGNGKYSLDSQNSGYFKATITDSGRKYYIYSDGEVSLGKEILLENLIVGIKVEENSTIDGKAYSSTNPLIPAGFKAVNMDNAKWNARGGPEVDNGLVIIDESGNEFVWVPVTTKIDENGYGLDTTDKREPDVIIGEDGNSYDAVAENLTKAGCIENSKDNDTVLTADDFKVQLTEEYKAMAESVNKYGGFYVGRFETSKNGNNPQSKRSQTESGSDEVIRTEISNWYDSYALNKKYNTTSVQGSMIWGSQYNAMMSWMGESAEKTGTRNTSTECGANDNDVIKNVYDIYGNCREWTLEANESTYRLVRGGSGYWCYNGGHGGTMGTYVDSKAPKFSYGAYPTNNYVIFIKENPNYGNVNVGSRLALYIK